ncbi:hypothetical protein QF030_003170 [Streptomyces rishiriensis]|uniref:Uncharacterized protein n=1 Tax=Streptomyces rishiriensis TaxID=68264 RepID=A0ABU0NR21_STRRH|nr:hypothetical protein [Streptomyces rishiriensis]
MSLRLRVCVFPLRASARGVDGEDARADGARTSSTRQPRRAAKKDPWGPADGRPTPTGPDDERQEPAG